jgi:tRNA threonylcarbamoyladenosine biosynthesis protein TsaB
MALRLVIDTALNALSVGLYQDAQALFEFNEIMQKGHQEALGSVVYAAFKSQEYKIHDLTAIGVTLGPGSFTGLRVGLSFAKGMSVGAKIPLFGLSTLDALLIEYFEDLPILSIMDAGRQGVYVNYCNHPSKIQSVILENQPDALLGFSKAHEARMIVGPACNILRPYYKNAYFMDTQTPSPRALYRLLVSDFARKSLLPLYMRDADASVSQKPKVTL